LCGLCLNITYRGLKLLLLGLIITKVFCLDIVHRILERARARGRESQTPNHGLDITHRILELLWNVSVF